MNTLLVSELRGELERLKAFDPCGCTYSNVLSVTVDGIHLTIETESGLTDQLSDRTHEVEELQKGVDSLTDDFRRVEYELDQANQLLAEVKDGEGTLLEYREQALQAKREAHVANENSRHWQAEFASEVLDSAADMNEFTGFDFLKGQYAGRKIGAEVLETIGRRLEYHDGDSAPRQILLVAEVRIHRHQHVKFSFRCC